MIALLDRLRRFADRDYRAGHLSSRVRSSIAYQVRAIRQKLGLTQKGMGERIGKSQSVVARMENDDYGRLTVQSLLDVAIGADVALVIRFVSYPDFLQQMSDMSSAALQPQNIYETLEAQNVERTTEEMFGPTVNVFD